MSVPAHAQYKQAVDTSNTLIGTYNYNLRFGDTQLWSGPGASGVNTFTRYMNSNFGPSGEVLLSTGSSGVGSVLRLNAGTGATTETFAGNSNTRSVTYLGGVYYYGTGSGNINASTGALDDGSITANGVGSGTVSLATDGTVLFSAGSSDDSVRRHTVSGETVSSATHTSSSIGADPRGMVVHNGNVYVSTGSTGTISVFSATDLSSVGTLSGTTPGFNNEGFAIFTLGGIDWYIGSETNGGVHHLVVRELTSATTLSGTADFYRYAATGDPASTAFNLIDNNNGLTGLSINVTGANTALGYFGSNSNAGVWAYSLTFLDDETVVPEPASLALLAMGGMMIAGRRRRVA